MLEPTIIFDGNYIVWLGGMVMLIPIKIFSEDPILDKLVVDPNIFN